MDKDIERFVETGNFREFCDATTDVWRTFARKLMQRWRCPPSVEVEDVVQELLFNAWLFQPKYDPSRGTTPRDYIVFNAVQYTKRWMHKQRGASRINDDKSPSVIPISLSVYPCDSPTAATQDVSLDVIMTLSAKAKDRPKFRQALLSLVVTDFDRKTAESLMVEDGVTKLEAKRAIRRVCQEVEQIW